MHKMRNKNVKNFTLYTCKWKIADKGQCIKCEMQKNVKTQNYSVF